jgi:hypothetical protein
MQPPPTFNFDLISNFFLVYRTLSMRQKTKNHQNQGSIDKKFDFFPQFLGHIPRWVHLVQKTRAKNSHAWAPLRFFCKSTFESVMRKENYCERRNKLSSRKQVALPNPHIHLCLFKPGYDVLALLSSVMYILSGESIAGVYPMSHIVRHQNSWHVQNRLHRAGTLCVQLLHLPPWLYHQQIKVRKGY